MINNKFSFVIADNNTIFAIRMKPGIDTLYVYTQNGEIFTEYSILLKEPTLHLKVQNVPSTMELLNPAQISVSINYIGHPWLISGATSPVYSVGPFSEDLNYYTHTFTKSDISVYFYKDISVEFRSNEISRITLPTICSNDSRMKLIYTLSPFNGINPPKWISLNSETGELAYSTIGVVSGTSLKLAIHTSVNGVTQPNPQILSLLINTSCADEKYYNTGSKLCEPCNKH